MAVNYRQVNENPCHMCMPMGGIFPFKGVAGSMVIIHGSQGCSTYMRRHMAEHFSEPIDVASSSLNEKEAIYGGEDKLKQGLDNLIRLYHPGLIGILTTCLAETIGEDIGRIVLNYSKERGQRELPAMVTVPTPGYGGTQAEGYFLALKRIIAGLGRKTERHSRINLLVPNISPADIREIKRIMELMQVAYTICPDYSDTLDAPFQRPYRKVPPGGTELAAIAAMPGAPATIQLGITVEDRFSPGRFLEFEFGVPLYTLPLPMGIEATDRFIQLLGQLSGRVAPESLQRERGRLLDGMIDSHKYNAEGKSVVFGEPESVYAVTRLCLENGIRPVVIATGSKKGKLAALLPELLRESDAKACILEEADFTQIRARSRELGANLAIGHSDGRYLTEREGIPLVRHGFPIHDRVGGQRLLSVGYLGSMNFLDRITNTLLERKQSSYREKMFRRYYRPAKPAGGSGDGVRL
jgi:nitrogenase molybdenum-iron protein NifN